MGSTRTSPQPSSSPAFIAVKVSVTSGRNASGSFSPPHVRPLGMSIATRRPSAMFICCISGRTLSGSSPWKPMPYRQSTTMSAVRTALRQIYGSSS